MTYRVRSHSGAKASDYTAAVSRLSFRIKGRYFVRAEAFARLHDAAGPFFSSAGQLTITVSGGEA
jgi:hypothetical protein